MGAIPRGALFSGLTPVAPELRIVTAPPVSASHCPRDPDGLGRHKRERGPREYVCSVWRGDATHHFRECRVNETGSLYVGVDIGRSVDPTAIVAEFCYRP